MSILVAARLSFRHVQLPGADVEMSSTLHWTLTEDELLMEISMGYFLLPITPTQTLVVFAKDVIHLTFQTIVEEHDSEKRESEGTTITKSGFQSPEGVA